MSFGIATLCAAALRGGIKPLQGARGWLCSLIVNSSGSHGCLPDVSFCRSAYSLSERNSSSVVPVAIVRELQNINSLLNADSRIDGRLRQSLILSAQSLPAALPAHDIESELPCLVAHVRPKEGMIRCAVKWLRRSGRVPGQVHSLTGSPGPGGRPVWELNVHFDENELARMVRTFGRNGCTARVLQLKLVRPAPSAAPLPPQVTASSSSTTQLADDSLSATCTSRRTRDKSGSGGDNSSDVLGYVRVKPVRVHMNAVTQRLEGIELIYCPVDRVVQVDVPIRLVNDEMAPGVRKGGWMSLFKRTVRYKALGNSIPPFIELNVRHMDLDQSLLVREMPIPPGTKIYEKNFNAPVVRCTTDVGND